MRWAGLGVMLAAAASGCGLNVQSADLFLLTRTGQGHRLTLLVNDGGTIRCNGGAARRLPDPLLLRARDLASALAGDAKQKLRIPPAKTSVYEYTVKLQDGTISFPDSATAGGRYPHLAEAELFSVDAAQQACA